MKSALLNWRVLAVLILGTLVTLAQGASDGQENPQSICGLKHLDRCFVDLAHDQVFR
jgi:hypothetical protein